MDDMVKGGAKTFLFCHITQCWCDMSNAWILKCLCSIIFEVILNLIRSPLWMKGCSLYSISKTQFCSEWILLLNTYYVEDICTQETTLLKAHAYLEHIFALMAFFFRMYLCSSTFILSSLLSILLKSYSESIVVDLWWNVSNVQGCLWARNYVGVSRGPVSFSGLLAMFYHHQALAHHSNHTKIIQMNQILCKKNICIWIDYILEFYSLCYLTGIIEEPWTWWPWSWQVTSIGWRSVWSCHWLPHHCSRSLSTIPAEPRLLLLFAYCLVQRING